MTADLSPHGAEWRFAADTVWLPTAAEMAELDHRATADGAIPERALIENAGREVARQLHQRWPEGTVMALVGGGNNGADALVAVRTLRAWGREVRAVLCGGRAPAVDVLRGWELSLEPSESLPDAALEAAVLLDGILGTGLSDAPRQPQARLIDAANASGRPIVAVDGPSGVDFTTGQVPGACVRARLTVALGYAKLGLLRYPARAFCGDLVAVEIGFPPPPSPLGARLITEGWVRGLLPSRFADGHKGRSGYLAVVAGQKGMAGACVLAARAAVRGGAGIVRVIGDPANREIVQAAVPEAIFTPWDDEAAVRDSAEWAHAFAIGPGLGRGGPARALVERLLELAGNRPLLLDADALNAWEEDLSGLRARIAGPAIVTPHPGELARMLGVPVEHILEDPPARAREAAAALGCAVLLKGSPSMVAVEGEPLRVSPIASPALATGGTGDVLSGLTGAYLAAGAPPADAGAAALLVSGLAADRGAAVGRSPSDVVEAIPQVRSRLDGPAVPCRPGVLLALAASRAEARR